jgi:lambda family phage portal protein
MKPNIIDRAVAWIAPAAGVRRLRQRAAMDVLQRGYDGAAQGRNTGSWNSRATSADAEVGANAALLRDRMRDLVRNNPHAANALSVLVESAIGNGIVPRAKDPKINRLFKEWVRKCDADGQLDFYGIQALAARGMFESGDGIIRRRRRTRADKLPVPLQLQVLETDMLDNTKDGVQSNGRVAIQGVEFDALGKRTGYWMYPTHPGNSHLDLKNAWQSTFIPAADIAHVYEKQRTQVRGVPWGTPAISTIYDLGSYEAAELMRKRIEACLVGVVVGGDEDGLGLDIPTDGKPGVYDGTGAIVEKFEAGMFLHAQGGKDIKFNQPAATGGYDAWKNSNLHTIAAGFRVPHFLLTQRLDGVNYSSSKVGLEYFNRTIAALQWRVIIPMLCQPLWDWFIEAAYLDGKIKTMDVPVEWCPPRFYSADPKKDAEAVKAEVRAGTKTLAEAIAETGRDPDEVLLEHAEMNEKLDDLGLVFDSDPRKMSGNGQVQQIGGSPDGDADEPPDKEEAA